MPRKIIPKECGCGCGGVTKGDEFLPGHDSKTLSAVIEAVGGTSNLKLLVESVLNRQIEVKL